MNIRYNRVIFLFLGASFAEALGMCSIPQPSKKRQSNLSNSNPSKPSKTELMSPVTNKKLPAVKIEPECNDNPNVIFIFYYIVSLIVKRN